MMEQPKPAPVISRISEGAPTRPLHGLTMADVHGTFATGGLLSVPAPFELLRLHQGEMVLPHRLARKLKRGKRK